MKRFCLLISLLLSIVVSSTVHAVENPRVVISDSAASIPPKVVQNILASHPDAEVITITGWHETAPENGIMICGTDWVNLSATTTQTNVALNTYFVISVARGASTTLTAEFNKTRSSSTSIDFTNGVSGIAPPFPVKIGRSRTVTARILVTRVFSGPSESSEYNSRSFYVRFYGDMGTWSGTAVNTVNPAARVPCSGSWTMPTSYAEYSIDSLIE